MEALKMRISDEKLKEEWVDGIYNMSPAASPKHNQILNELTILIGNYLKGKKCKMFRENIDLILADPRELSVMRLKEAEKETKVRPDLLVFCQNVYTISGNNIVGIPDFFFEVLSPGSMKWDMVVKKEKYLSAGVQEYWIIDPLNDEVLVFCNGTEITYSFDDTVKVQSLNDFEINFPEVMSEIVF